MLVRPVAFAQIEVGDMAGEGEAGGQLVVVLGLRRRDDGGCDLGVGEVVVVEVQLVGDDADGAGLLELLELGAPRVPICLVSDSAFPGAAGGGHRTVVEHPRP